nr:Ig-like domain-containing protein [Mycolicibacterium sphagni]
MLLDAVAAIRRATDASTANGVPVLHPREVYQFVTGEVLGDLLPTDPDGNKLTYKIVQGPANGTLTINPNGTYYYKPTNEFAESGGVDNFIVVSDDGQQGQTVVPVNVRVMPTLGISESFWFRNYTLAPIKFTGYNGGTGDLDGGPAVGTVILPGGEAGWSVTWYLFSVGSVTPQFGTVGFGATPSNPGYIPDGYTGTTFQVTYKTKPRETQCSAGGGGQCSVPNDRMAIALDKDSPTITLGPEDAAKIAAVLPNVCYDGSIAGCSFIAKSETKGFSPVRTVGTPVSNTTSTPTTYSIAIADQVSQSDTVGLSVKLSGGALAKLASLINIEITANYSHTWVKTNTFTQTMNVPVGAGKTAWIEGSVPVWNVTGDFTIKLGNSTYQLNGATFTTPNPNEAGSYVIKEKPITSAQD